MPDGMDELLARREVGKGRRYVPMPKHPKAAVSTASPTTDPETDRIGTRAVAVAEKTAPADTGEAPSAQPVAHRRSRVRPTQVHLDEASEDHLTAIRKRAVMADVPISNSAVLRLALAELVEHHSYDRIVTLFAEDESQPRPGRPRNA